MNKKPPVYDGKIKRLWPFLVHLHNEMPGIFDDPDKLRETVAARWIALKDPNFCPNCGSNMRAYVSTFDFHKALLLLEMANVVRQKVESGMSFTNANKVHVVSNPNLSDACRHQTTQARFLGLIAKVTDKDGKHIREDGWLITRRGWSALRGDPVPKEVIHFNNEVIDRTDESITLKEALDSNKHSVAGEIYDMETWVKFAGNIEGIL